MLFHKMLGEVQPNSNGIVNLEKQRKKSIWEEYKGDQEYKGRRAMSYDAFCKLWRISFPHVRIRVYKQVTGEVVWFLLH